MTLPLDLPAAPGRLPVKCDACGHLVPTGVLWPGRRGPVCWRKEHDPPLRLPTVRRHETGEDQTTLFDLIKEMTMTDSTGKTLDEMTTEVRHLNEAKGWRTGSNTFGDYIALLHSELSEALEAYRDYRLDDATELYECPPEGCYAVKDCADGHDPRSKPEGVGSEFADVLIRLLDTCDVYGIDLAAEYERKIAYNRTRPFQHGGRTLADAQTVAGVR